MDKKSVVRFKYRDGMMRVYWNLHKKCYSIAIYHLGKWSKIEHKDNIQLRDAFPVIYDRGKERVRREKRKNVHAFVVGYPTEDLKIGLSAITYNPYEHDSFIIDGLAGEAEWNGSDIIMKVDNYPEGRKPRIHVAF